MRGGAAVLDALLGQWHDHLVGQPEAGAADSAAMVTWPARDVGGVNALLRRGMQALTVIAVRPAEPAEPPRHSGWIAGMTRPGVTVYLQTMFVRPGVRGSGVGAALVRHVHGVLDARGVQTTLLHYALMNPLSAPFWNRMGYRPLWTGWEVRPAASLR